MIAAAIGPVAVLLGDILKRVLPPKMSEIERAQIEAAIQTELLKADWGAIQGQLAINTEEAKSASLFVAGWRPFIGWVCGGSFAWAALVRPLLEWTLALCGVDVPPLPTLAADLVTPILGAMLGLGGMRSFEKYKGVAR